MSASGPSGPLVLVMHSIVGGSFGGLSMGIGWNFFFLSSKLKSNGQSCNHVILPR